MPLEYDPISSNATRDVFLDLTDALETDETISAVTATSGDPNLEVQSKVNSSPTEDGTEIGKGVEMALTTLGGTGTVGVTVSYTGTAGSKDTYLVTVPIVSVLIK